jgi:hypothetical protein
MDDIKEFEKLGFNISSENIQRLIKYVASQKLKGEKATRSGVVNTALDLFFKQSDVSEQLENIA